MPRYGEYDDLLEILRSHEKRLSAMEKFARVGAGFSSRPFIPFTMQNIDTTADVNTAINVWDTLYISEIYVQLPSIELNVQVETTDGTTAGEVRLRLDGGILAGTTQTRAAGAGTTLHLLSADISSVHSYLELGVIELQARRTAGSGVFRVGVLRAVSIELA